ncbi:hypothetical protein [Bifidobacterium sp.]|uniref:hypothetical protein n=1 Tax=Bifidobacterium sp. TaxID=41200 RepID=UPI0039E84926
MSGHRLVEIRSFDPERIEAVKRLVLGADVLGVASLAEHPLIIESGVSGDAFVTLTVVCRVSQKRLHEALFGGDGS